MKEYKYSEPIKSFDYKLANIKIHHVDSREHRDHPLNIMFNQYNELNRILFKNNNNKNVKFGNQYIMGLTKALGMNLKKDALSEKNMESKEHII